MKRFALMLLIASVAFAAELTGKWSGTFEPLGPDGSSQGSGGAYMDLKLSGQTVTGTAGQDEANQNPISNGKLDGKKLTFDVVRGQGTLKIRPHIRRREHQGFSFGGTRRTEVDRQGRSEAEGITIWWGMLQLASRL